MVRVLDGGLVVAQHDVTCWSPAFAAGLSGMVDATSAPSARVTERLDELLGQGLQRHPSQPRTTFPFSTS
jgi:hypothetical protein